MHTIENSSTLRVQWKKSSFSGADNNCVEVAPAEGGEVHLRDNKNPAGPAHTFSADAWAAFLADIKAGRFDLLCRVGR